jgi:hypothetical protein
MLSRLPLSDSARMATEPASSLQRSASGSLGWAAIAMSLLVALLWVVPWLLRQDLFYDDAAHHVFWLYQYASPGLFPDDISIEYFRTNAPWGYRAIYFALAPLFDAQMLAEFLAIPLVLLSCWFLWRIARAAGAGSDESGMHGLLLILGFAVFLLVSQARDLVPPIAFQRTFSVPLLLFTCWALAERRYGWVGASWLAAALIYPVVLPLQGIAAVVVFLRELIATRRLPAHWVLNLVLGVAALGIAAVGVPVPPEVGPAYSYTEAMTLPEFGPQGRLRMYEEGFLASWFRGHRAGLGWSKESLLLIVACAGLAIGLRRQRLIPMPVWVMAGAGLLIFLAMRAFPDQLMFGLYLPNRHPKWSLAIFGAFAFAAAVSALLGRAFSETVPATAARLRWVGALGIVAVLVVLGPQAREVWARPVNTDLERSYAFLRTMPLDTLVASHPDLGDFVPLRTRRSVLTSTETSMAWMKSYYAAIKPRVSASLEAAYATRIEDVDAALSPFGVDVMLVGPEIWAARTPYLEPFGALSTRLVERGRVEGFVLRSPPADRILFRSGDYYVIRVRNCAAAGCG